MATDAFLRGRSVITLKELTKPETLALVRKAIELKNQKKSGIYSKKLTNKNIGLVFLHPSCRTRISFAVAASDEGACAHVISPDEVRFGTGESVKDIARVMGRMFDGIAIRADSTDLVEEVAEHAGVPVWNAMSHDHHPTQALADLMTLQENGINPEGAKVAFVGHGRGNVISSLMAAAAKVGMDLRIVAPKGTEPDDQAVGELFGQGAHPAAKLMVTNDPEEGLAGCQAVYADMWVHVDSKDDFAEQSAPFKGYRVTSRMMRMTGRPDTIFMHCMPSQHSSETAFAKDHPYAIDTSDDVFEGTSSRVFDQAENRMHSIKALMVSTVV